MSPPDFALARNLMVDGQIRPNKVIDPRIISAMRRLPRELFLPPALAALAYSDDDIPLGHGRVLIEPMTIARLVQAAELRGGEKVLVAACGSGYGAALLAACGASVTALEEEPELLALARTALPLCAPAVTLVAGSIAQGHPGPWNVILIEGAVTSVPPIYANLLKPQGRLLTVISSGGRVGQAVVAEAQGGALATRALFDCATPLLPSLRSVAKFAF